MKEAAQLHSKSPLQEETDAGEVKEEGEGEDEKKEEEGEEEVGSPVEKVVKEVPSRWKGTTA